MPRKARFNLPGFTQHIIQRGNNRERCFISSEDYLQYLEDLKESAEKYDCHIHAYVLMPNHVHLLVTPMADNGVSKLMQSIGRRYVYYFNKTYRRTGTLWEGRYRSSLIDSSYYLLDCMRYIEMNPVRKGLVEQAEHYPWSSFAINAQGEINHLISPHPVYMELGSMAESRQDAYLQLVKSPLHQRILNEIRDSVNQELVLGRSYFKDKIEKMTQRQTRKGLPGRPRVEEEGATYYRNGFNYNSRLIYQGYYLEL